MEDLTGKIALWRPAGSPRVSTVRVVEGAGDIVKIVVLSEERSGKPARTVHRNSLTVSERSNEEAT